MKAAASIQVKQTFDSIANWNVVQNEGNLPHSTKEATRIPRKTCWCIKQRVNLHNIKTLICILKWQIGTFPGKGSCKAIPASAFKMTTDDKFKSIIKKIIIKEKERKKRWRGRGGAGGGASAYDSVPADDSLPAEACLAWTHLRISRPRALASGGGTAFPTWWIHFRLIQLLKSTVLWFSSWRIPKEAFRSRERVQKILQKPWKGPKDPLAAVIGSKRSFRNRERVQKILQEPWKGPKDPSETVKGSKRSFSSRKRVQKILQNGQESWKILQDPEESLKELKESVGMDRTWRCLSVMLP